MPGSGTGAIPAEVARAEASIRASHPDVAEALLVGAGGLSAAAPERSWLLVELWSTRAALSRARAAVAAMPPSPFAAVLSAHVAGDPERRLATLRRLEAGPAAGWAHLEAAYALAEEGRREGAARAHAARAAAIGPAYVRREALLLAAHEALEAKEGSAALALALSARDVDPRDPRPLAAASRYAARLGRNADAARWALDALRLQPSSLRVARRLADLLREDPDAPVDAGVARGVATVLPPPEGNPELDALRGLLAERAGRAEEAVAAYERALAAGADPVPVDRHLRRLLLARGDVRGALEWLRAAVPPGAVARPGNVVARAWAALDAAAARAEGGGDDEATAGLARALEGVGAVEEAAIVARSRKAAAGDALSARLDGVVAFERAIRRAVEEGYRAPAEGKEPEPVERLLARIAELARRHLPASEHAAFADPARGLRTVPLVGTWLDHGVSTSSPVVAWFRAHGQYLVLGQREEKPAEAVLLSLASLVPGAPVSTHGRTFRHDVAVGYDRAVRPYLDFQGGRLSGAALPDGVWLDADAARHEDAALRLVRRADAALVARAREAGKAPPAPDGPEGVLAMDDPAGLSLRLALDHVERAGTSPWASFAVLEAHESAHVFDLERHLPVARGLPATLSLLARSGLSLDVAESRLEGRAQLSAVVESGEPRLAVLDLVGSLPSHERAPEAHERGYRDVVARLLRTLYARSDRYPAIDPSRKLLPQLDRLTPREWVELAVAIDEDR
jgi:hypothetical protein